jgi:hypothetical protein
LTPTAQICGNHSLTIDCDRASAVAYRAQCAQAIEVALADPAALGHMSSGTIVDDASSDSAVDDVSSSSGADDDLPALADVLPVYNDGLIRRPKEAASAKRALEVPISELPVSIKKLADRDEQSVSRGGARLVNNLERRKALHVKYSLPEPESAMPATEPVQTVRRSIHKKMRFLCHCCKTQNGSSKVCSQCNHQRCRDCSRYLLPEATTGSVSPNALAWEDPLDNDGPDGSRQSGGIARLGLPSSNASLQAPDRAIV